VAGVREHVGHGRLDVRIERRGGRVAGAAGGSGAHFERVALRVDGRRLDAVLKVMAPDDLSPPLERRFYRELAAEVSARVPRVYATGELAGTPDGWVLLEVLPPGKPRTAWTSADLLACAREIARLHAPRLGRAPAWLPRPLTRDARLFLAHVPAGVARLRSFVAARPAWRWFAPERAMAAAEALARDPSPIVEALARSPETLIHRDCHVGNVAVVDGERPILFDWEAVSAGPPIFDLALFFRHLDWQWTVVPLLGVEWSRLRPPPLEWDELAGAYLDELEERAHAPIDRAVIAAAAPAAFAWEAAYRIGWIEPLLARHAGWMRLARSRVPLLGPLARWLVDLPGLLSRATLWPGVERFAPGSDPGAGAPGGRAPAGASIV